MGAVFLDLDGTLVDPKPGITGSVIHALRGLGLPAPSPDDLEWVIGPPLLDSFARLGAPDPAAALALYRARYADTGLFEARVYDGIPGSLEVLKSSGHRLCLATAKPHVFAARIIAHFGLAGFLDGVHGPELDGTRNDKGELLLHALGREGIEARDAVMVGDRGFDIKAARRAGMPAVAVGWGFGDADELADAEVHCATVADLAECVAVAMRGPDGSGA